MASPKQARSGFSAALKSTSVALAIAALAACGGGGGGGASTPDAGVPVSSPGAPVATGTPVGTGTSTGASASGTGPAASATGAALAPVVFQRADFQVNTNTAGSQAGANVARLATGGYVVVWDSSPSYGAVEVHMQRLDAQGQPAGAEQVVSAQGNGSQVTAFADGKFLVTWRFSPYAYQVDAHGQMFDAQGGRVGGEMLLGSALNSYLPRPMALPDGSFIAAIDTEAGKYGPSYGLLQRYGADGTPVGQATRLESQLSVQMTSYSPNSAGQAHTALLADGRIAAAWVARGTGIAELRLTLLDGQAVPLSTSTLLSGAEALYESPAITALSGGGAMVSWVTGAYDQAKTAYIAMLDASGTMGTPQVLATTGANVDLTVQLATLADGNVVATWSTASFDPAALRTRSQVAQRFSGSTGAALGAALPIDTATSDGTDNLFPVDSQAVTAMTGSGFLALYGRWTAQDSWEVRATVR